MAELKTYTCDIPGCKNTNAVRLTIPSVQYQTDPASGKRDGIDAYVDVCREHFETVFALIFDVIETTQEQRRKIWKGLFGRWQS